MAVKHTHVCDKCANAVAGLAKRKTWKAMK
jgi:hypothetical protein